MNASPQVQAPAARDAAGLPLVVDLDGTLIKTDMLAETANDFLVTQPWRGLRLLAWLAAGRPTLKARLAQATQVDVATQPYNEELLRWLGEEKRRGRHLVLATASDRELAERVAAHLGLFDEVLASDGVTNLKSQAKRDALIARFGAGRFEYVGNDWPDLAIWRAAARAHVVSRSARLIAHSRRNGNLGRVLDDGKPAPAAGLLRAMRPHQWMKNLLVLVPLLAAHQYGDGASVLRALLALVVFGLCASSVYLLNDLVDVEDDRHHRRKRHRPFASGQLSLLTGWLAWPLLLAAGFGLAALWLPPRFSAALAAYFVLTVSYSFRLKRMPMVDVLALAALYTLRIIAGAYAVAVPLSFWLLAFSMFTFLSLAFIKRYSELRAAREAGQARTLRGRGYDPQDLELVSSLGSNAGYMAVLVLAFYIQDSHTASLYGTPTLIWLACPLLLYWISRAWLIAHRGQMHDDPIVFALKDRASWLIGALFGAVFVLARTLP
ncbi:UbiA family prenyltransferase [Rugamonas apoptosis]|uniref:UbiA family prenyltransferase n=1 Tax=Rugamonas apoptosis TaxID=2758570 RepID=A0A7W2IJ03_9BURK|nr:UbiA family prenyltransferase [Rugamonas apoptosis]